MAQMKERPTAKPGDLVVVSGHHVGESERLGEILEVLDPGPRQHYRVRWEDGRETIFYPSSDAIVRPKSRPKPRPKH